MKEHGDMEVKIYAAAAFSPKVGNMGNKGII
jgi:hypothetical protein